MSEDEKQTDDVPDIWWWAALLATLIAWPFLVLSGLIML
jgi:hypothetical protein